MTSIVSLSHTRIPNIAMASTMSFESGHEDMIHDAQLDYYGKRLATASSDRSVRIFDVSGPQQQLVAELKGHEGPVWQVAWGHPKFGSLLATCSYDRKVIIWKEEENGTWIKLFDNVLHESSVNSVAWAPHVFGLILASASADGKICIMTYKPETNVWEREVLSAPGGLGLNAISWAPGVPSASLVDHSQTSRLIKRFVTGGCDGRVRIWTRNDTTNVWDSNMCDSDDTKHGDWVRDVAWAPTLGLPTSTIASCSEDQTVAIWSEPVGQQGQPWTKVQTLQFDAKVWRVSWSIMGNILAVSQGDNKVSMWKEGADGVYAQMTTLTENDQDQVNAM